MASVRTLPAKMGNPLIGVFRSAISRSLAWWSNRRIVIFGWSKNLCLLGFEQETQMQMNLLQTIILTGAIYQEKVLQTKATSWWVEIIPAFANTRVPAAGITILQSFTVPYIYSQAPKTRFTQRAWAHISEHSIGVADTPLDLHMAILMAKLSNKKRGRYTNMPDH